MRRTFAAPAALLLALSVAAPLVACTKEDPAGIVLALQTDMIVPDDISAVAIVISETTTGRIVGDPIIHPTAPSPDGNAVRFPATLTLETAFESSTFTTNKKGKRILSSVQITLVGLKGKNVPQNQNDTTPLEQREARVLRRIVTTMPEEGMHLLRINLGTLDLDTVAPIENGSTKKTPTGLDVLTNYALLKSNCNVSQDRVGGSCKTIPSLDGTVLPEFAAANVFGGATNGKDAKEGACFDLARCFDPSNLAVRKLEVTLGANGCRATLPEGVGTAPNLAYERTDSAQFSANAAAVCIADRNGRHCLFSAPPNDDTSFGEEGYKVENNTLLLPIGVCNALDTLKIDGLWASPSDASGSFEKGCPKSSPTTPTCSIASAVGTPSTAGVADAGDAGDQAFAYPFNADFLAVCIAHGLPVGTKTLPDGGVDDPGIPIRFRAHATYAPLPDGTHSFHVSFASLGTDAGTIEPTIGDENTMDAVIQANGDGTATANNLVVPPGAFSIPQDSPYKDFQIEVGGSSAQFALKVKNNARFCANLNIVDPYYRFNGSDKIPFTAKPVVGPCFFGGPYDATYPVKTYQNSEITCP